VGAERIHEDKQSVFFLADRGMEEISVHPAKAADESTIRLLLGKRQQESVTVYTDGFRAYEPLGEDDAFDRRYVVHGGGEYADEEVHVNTSESHASLSRRWLSPHRGVSKDKLTPYLRAFQLRQRVRRKPGDEALKPILEGAP
jgi:transposase